MYNFRTLRSDELDRWLDHCARSFGGEFVARRKGFHDHWFRDPDRDPNSVFVAVEGSQIVSAVRVFDRSYYLGGETIAVGGIGEVSTHPDHRGKGLAGELMKRSIVYMKRHGYPVSMLGAVIRDYYSKFGWQQVPMRQRISCVPAGAGRDANSVTLRKMKLPEDLAGVAELHRAFSSAFNGATARSDQYWVHWVGPQLENTTWVLQDDAGSILSYAIAEVQKDLFNIKEYGSRENEPEVFDETVRQLVEALAPGSTKIVVKHPCCVATSMKLEREDEWPFNMFRLISPFNAQGQRIRTTDDLVELLKGSTANERCTDYLYWHTDSI